MNYGAIKDCDIANGLGVRVSLFVSGCTHYCRGCFNECAWDFEYGEAFTDDTIEYILSLLKPYYISGLSLLGGEPLDPRNQEQVSRLVGIVKDKLPNKDIWLYTGYTYETLDSIQTPYLGDILSNIDVLVDGEFIQELHDITLKFRGSVNQRIIDMNKTRELNRLVLMDNL